MVSRIQEWAAEQWFNGPEGGTPITKDRLNRVETQVEGITVDLNGVDDLIPDLATKAELAAAIAGIDIDDPDFDAFVASLDPTMRDVVLGTGTNELTNAALVQLIQQFSTSLYRGVWDAFTVEKTLDFLGGYPAEITEMGVVDRVGYVQGSIGTNPPTVHVARIGNPVSVDLNNNTAGLQLTVPAGITSVRFWGILVNGDSNNNGNSTIRYTRNGGAATTVRNGSTAPLNTWTQHTVGVAAGDVLQVYLQDVSNYGTRGGLAYFEFLSSQKPYVVNEVVSYNGKLYRNAANNNAAVPGADATWVSVIDPIPATTDIKNIVRITQAAYTALTTKVATTLYVIVG